LWPLTLRRLKWLYVVAFAANGAAIVVSVYAWQAFLSCLFCVSCTISARSLRRHLDHR
jgi:hypothetical protein